ncbi:MAG: hypothetical protein II937_13875 [Bacteroidales bacterium]|nr:hypothetical protein [Bacteroidales bacterium]
MSEKLREVEKYLKTKIEEYEKLSVSERGNWDNTDKYLGISAAYSDIYEKLFKN